MSVPVREMPHLLIEAACWWTAAPPAGALLGAVLVHDTLMGTVKAFIGQGHGFDVDADCQLIAAWGAKLSPDVGRAIFPAHAGQEWADDPSRPDGEPRPGEPRGEQDGCGEAGQQARGHDGTDLTEGGLR